MSLKRELARKISINSKITNKAALIAVETMFDDIKEKILNEKTIIIPRFLVIKSKISEARICHRFTGKPKIISPRFRLKYRFTQSQEDLFKKKSGN